MIANGQTVEKLFDEALQLSVEERLLLVQRVIDSLVVLPSTPLSQPLRYGQFANSTRELSKEQDFVIAEWHPTEQQLDGE